MTRCVQTIIWDGVWGRLLETILWLPLFWLPDFGIVPDLDNRFLGSFSGKVFC